MFEIIGMVTVGVLACIGLTFLVISGSFLVIFIINEQ